ncbi:MAG: hypothetical protein M1825_005037 [Sarcosagium campestre]|nr:MAG: hypothetical protein M1825_005037 [Sarcosagium campestre]
MARDSPVGGVEKIRYVVCKHEAYVTSLNTNTLGPAPNWCRRCLEQRVREIETEFDAWIAWLRSREEAQERQRQQQQQQQQRQQRQRLPQPQFQQQQQQQQQQRQQGKGSGGSKSGIQSSSVGGNRDTNNAKQTDTHPLMTAEEFVAGKCCIAHQLGAKSGRVIQVLSSMLDADERLRDQQRTMEGEKEPDVLGALSWSLLDDALRETGKPWAKGVLSQWKEAYFDQGFKEGRAVQRRKEEEEAVKGAKAKAFKIKTASKGDEYAKDAKPLSSPEKPTPAVVAAATVAPAPSRLTRLPRKQSKM